VSSRISPLERKLAVGTVDSLNETLLALLAYCRNANWAGWDPYDGLNSRLFQAIPFFQNKPCRLAFIQFMKRCPVNLRRLMMVPPGQNPKGLALFASALVRLNRLGLVPLNEARSLGDLLISRQCAGHRHACWGYHFDWQTRGVLVEKRVPNIVCTTFAGHALLDLYAATRHEAYRDVALSAARFIVDELAADLPDDAFCIRYFTVGSSLVHNASLLGAAYLARVFTLTGDPTLRTIALKATRYSVERQSADGSWPYGEGATQKWIDSFHTGYNLLALERIRHDLLQEDLEPVITRGYQFFLEHFFPARGTVSYFHQQELPIDSHAIATALITLVELARYDPRSLPIARNVFQWAFENMRSKDGSFYYQKQRAFTNKIRYMRWSEAWMLLALTTLVEASILSSPTASTTRTKTE
jgi:hypothetical protein